MNISTSIHLLAPKDHRWSAIDDETYDGAPDTTPRSPIGWGETQLDAVIDLIEQINDREDAELQAKVADDEARDAEEREIDQQAFERQHSWGKP